MRRRATSRPALLVLLLVAVVVAACGSGGGMGLDFTAGGPGWAPFTGGKMFGAPL
jgi:predicted small secreted protein